MAVNVKREAATSIDPIVWRVAAVVFAGPFMTQMDSTIVNVSLSTIRGELQASIAAAQWILSGYLLALALMLPVNGWLVDRVGARRLYLGCFSAFTLASLLCGAARTIDELILARILQGIAGGLMAPMAQMMMARVAGRNMARVMGYTAVPILIAPILGPVIAGAILKYAAWPWLFYVNLPVGILGVTLAFFLLPRDEASSTRRPFDLTGFLMLSPGLACLLYGFPRASHPDGLATLLIGALLMAGFVVHARRLKLRALIDLELFRIRIFSTAAATQFCANAAFYATQFLIPLYLITGCALSPGQAGWLVAAVGGGMMCSFPFVGTLTDRFGCRTVSAGGAVAALCGMLPFLWMSHSVFSAGVAGACLFVVGIGQGTINIPSVSAAYASVPRERIPVANSAINIVQRLGGPLATTLMAAVVSRAAGTVSVPAAHPFSPAFAVLVGLYICIFGAASRLPIRIHSGIRS
jgi:EmrB/QacA subfamily drug resistance transporter